MSYKIIVTLDTGYMPSIGEFETEEEALEVMDNLGEAMADDSLRWIGDAPKKVIINVKHVVCIEIMGTREL